MSEIETLAQQVVDQWATHQLAEAVRALSAALDEQRALRADATRYIAKAREDYAAPSDDDIAIDDEPSISDAEDGLWVSAWVMVRHDDVQEAEHG